MREHGEGLVPCCKADAPGGHVVVEVLALVRVLLEVCPEVHSVGVLAGVLLQGGFGKLVDACLVHVSD